LILKERKALWKIRVDQMFSIFYYCNTDIFLNIVKANNLRWFIMLGQMKALKDLGLDVSKGTVSTEGSVKQTKFFITRL
jgi:hypothetical protein